MSKHRPAQGFAIDNVRQHVVGVDRQVPLLDGSSCTYINFDNAASTPALRPVSDTVNEFREWYSSVHRGTGFKLTEAGNISNAPKIRDFAAKKSRFTRWFHRMRHMTFALVVRALKRTETIAVAMDVKAFGLSDERTYFTDLPQWRPGKIFGWASVAALVAFISVPSRTG